MATTRTIVFDLKTTGVDVSHQMDAIGDKADIAKTKVKGMADSMSASLANVGKKMQGLGTAMTVGLTTPLILAAKAGVEYNAQMEQYSASFSTMLGDDVKAAEYLLKLKEMSAKTPFEMTDLASSAKTLLAFGRSADQTTGDMQMLGDISQGNAQSFESLTRAFGKVASSGKMTGEDLNMMIDAGFNPLQIMADKSGKSMQDLRKDMEEGNISFEMMQDAMKTATSEGGMFFGSMEKQSKTLNGQLSTLKDTFMTALGEAVQPLSDFVANVLVPKITTLIEKFSALSPKAKTIALLIAGITTVLGPALILIGMMAQGVAALSGAYGKLVGGLKSFFIGQTLADGTTKKSTISLIANKVATVASTIATKAAAVATKALAIAQKLFNAAMNANPIMKIVALIILLVGAFITLWNTNEGFRKAVLQVWETVKAVFDNIWGKIQDVIAKIKNAFATVKIAIEIIFNAIKSVIIGIFQTIGNIIKTPINAIINGINTVLKMINKIKIPSWVPLIGGKHADFGMIPTLAKGGIVNSATQAIIGEGADPEAVVPLNKTSISNFVSGLGMGSPSGSTTIVIPQAKVALVDLNGRAIGNIILPQMTRSLKLGGALT